MTQLIAEGRDIAEIKRATQALVEQEATLRSFFDNAASMMGIVELDDDDDIRHIRDNAAARVFFQIPPETQDTPSARDRGVPEQVIAMWVSRYRESSARGVPVQFEYEHPSNEGTRWLSATVCPITPTTGASPRFAYVVQDITALKQQAERLEASLHEKEVLLREIHHRVKNNLQVITSMLHLQLRHVSEGPVRAQLAESERRVHAMALVHEQLYMAPDLAGIEFPSYVDRLVTTLVGAYRSSAHGVTIRARISPLMLDIDTAIPCGLLINELVSNSLAHAFRGDDDNEIRISFERADAEHLVLSVGDNGIGLPPRLTS
ncbi:MAG: sensor histidine kinase [Polyangiaceae bacterium]|nr:sensor histidine kinase [Polyangiaceae bacterium]